MVENRRGKERSETTICLMPFINSQRLSPQEVLSHPHLSLLSFRPVSTTQADESRHLSIRRLHLKLDTLTHSLLELSPCSPSLPPSPITKQTQVLSILLPLSPDPIHGHLPRGCLQPPTRLLASTKPFLELVFAHILRHLSKL